MSFSRNTVLKSFLWKLLERFSVQGITFVVSVVLARLLTPHDYGLIAVLMIFINIAGVFVDGGFASALIQKKDADNKDFSTVFLICIVVSVVVYLLLFFGAPLISSFYENSDLTIILRVLSISLLLDPINAMQVAYITKNLQFKNMFYSSMVAVVLSGTIGIVMAYNGFGVWSLVAQNIFSKIFTIIVMWFTVKWRPSFYYSKDRFKNLFGFGSKIFATNIIIRFFTSIRGLIIGKMYTPSMLALYDKGHAIPSMIRNNVNGTVQTVLFPVLSEAQDDLTEVKTKVRRSIKLVNFFLFPLFIGLFVVAEPLVNLLFTEKWSGAIPFGRIFCMAELLMSIQTVNLQAIISLGYSSITLKLESIKKVIEIVILVISCFLGVYAIACGVVLYNIICLFINLSPSKKLLNYPIVEQFRDVAPTFGISLLMGLCVFIVGFLGNNMSYLPLLAIQVIVGAFSYLLFCKVFHLDIYTYIINMINELKKKK